MDYEMIEKAVKVLFACGLGGYLLYFVIRFLHLNIRGWKQGRIPVETARAMVYCKHPDPDFVPEAQNIHDTSSGYIYYITFHTDTGDILKLYLNPRSFFAIEENAVGQLTWQGDRFWNFIPEEKKED